VHALGIFRSPDDSFARAAVGNRALVHAVAALALAASFGARSYAPGQTAYLHVTTDRSVTVQVFRAGAGSGPLALAPVDDPRRAQGPTIAVHLWDWPSGVYFARVGDTYAPFILRPAELGASRVAVVEPTNTWQAYNDYGGGSWYFGGPDTVSLGRPYLDDGVPPHFAGYDLGFLKWLDRTGKTVDFLSDDDLERLDGPAVLAHLYDLIVFPGHEEYVTPHVFDLISRYRDLGGNLAFLSADDFFYRVLRSGDSITRAGRWRDLGRPESALVGEEYIGWNERAFPNRPYEVVAPDSWAFAGTDLHAGSTFGLYGIEIDATDAASPPGTEVLARIPDAFGPGQDAQMTYYVAPSGAKVFSAGVMNFGGSADWPVVSTILENVWTKLTAR
jgi:hypothetical protein